MQSVIKRIHWNLDLMYFDLVPTSVELSDEEPEGGEGGEGGAESGHILLHGEKSSSTVTIARTVPPWS